VVETSSLLADDSAFDERLPVRLQVHASTFFTPLDVAAYAARLLAPEPGMTVLDVGAGVGKFCIAAALAVPGCQFVGVEWRPHLVDLANALARELGIANARFVHGDALELDWSRFDSFYFFNPFGELLRDHDVLLDRSIEHDSEDFIRCVSGARCKLARARVGTRVVTYHGFGAPLPPGYEEARDSLGACKRVELWIKTRTIACGVDSHSP
jgi:SAM-dependent methyltransferase